MYMPSSVHENAGLKRKKGMIRCSASVGRPTAVAPSIDEVVAFKKHYTVQLTQACHDVAGDDKLRCVSRRFK